MFTRISVSALVAVSALVSSCSDWTQPEKLNFLRQTPEQENPEQYAQYLESIKAYKETEHNLMLVGMNGIADYPSSQNQHIMAMPDSADYVFVKMGETLHEKIAAEIPVVLEKKGTKTLLYVDYAETATTWQALEDKRSDNGEAPGTDEELIAYFTEKTQAQIDRCNKYGFAGIIASFEGTAAAGYAYNSQNAFMTVVKKFHEENPDKVMFFRGGARNVIDQEFLKEFKAIIIVTGEEKKLAALPQRVLGSYPTNINVIMELTVPSTDVPEQVGETPYNAAKWIVETEHTAKYNPLGLSVANAHDDYFQKELAFINVRSAISMMNPKTTEE